MSVKGTTYHGYHTHPGQPTATYGPGPELARPADGVRPAPKTRPIVDESAKLPYRRPRVAIPPATLAAAMERGREAAAAMPGHVPGAPIIRQPVEVEEAYWLTVWQRLGRPDPGLPQGGKD